MCHAVYAPKNLEHIIWGEASGAVIFSISKPIRKKPLNLKKLMKEYMCHANCYVLLWYYWYYSWQNIVSHTLDL